MQFYGFTKMRLEFIIDHSNETDFTMAIKRDKIKNGRNENGIRLSQVCGRNSQPSGR